MSGFFLLDDLGRTALKKADDAAEKAAKDASQSAGDAAKKTAGKATDTAKKAKEEAADAAGKRKEVPKGEKKIGDVPDPCPQVSKPEFSDFTEIVSSAGKKLWKNFDALKKYLAEVDPVLCTTNRRH